MAHYDLEHLGGLVRDWLPRQRWYAGKGREIAELVLIRPLELCSDDGLTVVHTVAEVGYADGGRDSYQVPLAVRREPVDGHRGFIVGEVDDTVVYDGPQDDVGSAVLLRMLRQDEHVGDLRATRAPGVELADLPGQPVGVEQSNTSVVYGGEYILKLFRRLSPGLNPDLEVTRALAAAGSQHVAAPLAWLEAGEGEQSTTCALLQAFLRSGSEGWKLAVASVRDLYAEADLHPDEVGGDFAGESERLGAATAEVHALLATTLPSRTASPDEARATAALMQSRLAAAVTVVHELGSMDKSLHDAYFDVAGLASPVPDERVHGDYRPRPGRAGRGRGPRCSTSRACAPGSWPSAPRGRRRSATSRGCCDPIDYCRPQTLHMDSDSDAPGAGVPRQTDWADRIREAFCDGDAGTAVVRDARHETVLHRCVRARQGGLRSAVRGSAPA